MDFIEYTVKVHGSIPKNVRLGQHYFNVLSQIKPELAQRVSFMNIDPFYSDSKIPAFLAYVQKNWDN